MYTLKASDKCTKKYSKLTSKDSRLKDILRPVLNKLQLDPFYPGLRTHKVNSKRYGVKRSSRVTGDIRIIWEFYNSKIYIHLLDIGGHSGSGKVYN